LDSSAKLLEISDQLGICCRHDGLEKAIDFRRLDFDDQPEGVWEAPDRAELALRLTHLAFDPRQTVAVVVNPGGFRTGSDRCQATHLQQFRVFCLLLGYRGEELPNKRISGKSFGQRLIDDLGGLLQANTPLDKFRDGVLDWLEGAPLRQDGQERAVATGDEDLQENPPSETSDGRDGVAENSPF